MPEPVTTPDGIRFTSNYQDKSNQLGFQFEFRCERCRVVFRTPYKPSVMSGVTQAMDAAAGIFGGLFGKAARVGDKVRGVTWKNQRDAALAEAVAHVLPEFIQCSKCMSWVCRKACWNQERGLCKKCAPDIAVEMASSQAKSAVKAVRTTATISSEDQAAIDAERTGTILATCPKCEAPLAANSHFCPSCGADLRAEQHCAKCGAKLPAGAKFCADCGTKVP